MLVHQSWPWLVSIRLHCYGNRRDTACGWVQRDKDALLTCSDLPAPLSRLLGDLCEWWVEATDVVWAVTCITHCHEVLLVSAVTHWTLYCGRLFIHFFCTFLFKKRWEFNVLHCIGHLWCTICDDQITCDIPNLDRCKWSKLTLLLVSWPTERLALNDLWRDSNWPFTSVCSCSKACLAQLSCSSCLWIDWICLCRSTNTHH